MVVLAWIVLGILAVLFLAMVCSMDGGCVALVLSLIVTAIIFWAVCVIVGSFA